VVPAQVETQLQLTNGHISGPSILAFFLPSRQRAHRLRFPWRCCPPGLVDVFILSLRPEQEGGRLFWALLRKTD
jgi:hypothetical protein